MNHRVITRLAAVSLAFALVITCISAAVWPRSTHAATQGTAGQAAIGSVFITDKSTIELKQASILTGDEGKTVSFTLTVHNNNDYELQFIDYWVRLLNKSGTQFSVNILPQDKDKNRVPAHSSMDIGFYASVNSSVELQDLIFRIIKWDFSVPNYERRLGDITVPANYNIVTPAGSSANIPVSGTTLQTEVTALKLGKNDKYYLPKVILSYVNIGNKTAILPEYQYSIRTSEGLLYPLELSDESKKNNTSNQIYPRFVREMELVGSIPLSIETDGWQLVITSQVQTGNSSLTLPVAYFELPKATSDEEQPVEEEDIPVGEAKSIEIDKNVLEVRAAKLKETTEEEFVKTEITVAFKNTGKTTITVPQYRFYVRTKDGLTYPASAEGFNNLTVDPLVTKEVVFAAAIPLSVSREGMKLTMLPPAGNAGEDSTNTPIAHFALPEPSVEAPKEPGKAGIAYEFETKDGRYSAKLNGIQRLPWEDQDILSADFTIANMQFNQLPIPAFTGYFLLDGVVKVPAKVIIRDSIISIPSRTELNVQLYALIPYTNRYSTIEIVLQEKGAEGDKTLLQFTHNNSLIQMPVIKTGNAKEIDVIGKQAKVQVQQVRTYEGGSFNLFVTQINVTNMEKRFTQIPSLVAYFKTANDVVYPATITEIGDKITPGGMASLYVTTVLPITVDPSRLELVIGVGVSDGQVASAAKAEAYIDAASYELPDEKVADVVLRNLDIYPYTISFTNTRATVRTTSELAVTMDYRLLKDHLVTENIGDHNLVVEFVTDTGEVAVTESFTINKGTGSHDLKLGTGKVELIYNEFGILNKMAEVNYYTISVYDEYQGQRKLLAQERFSY